MLTSTCRFKDLTWTTQNVTGKTAPDTITSDSWGNAVCGCDEHLHNHILHTENTRKSVFHQSLETTDNKLLKKIHQGTLPITVATLFAVFTVNPKPCLLFCACWSFSVYFHLVSFYSLAFLVSCIIVHCQGAVMQ